MVETLRPLDCGINTPLPNITALNLTVEKIAVTPVLYISMFSNKQKLIKRTGRNGVGRSEFIKLLVTEFHITKSKDAKEQVVANLANFSYDPINYEFLRSHCVIDLFLSALSEENKRIIRFAIGGICNLCLDPVNKTYILRNQGISLISSLLLSQDDEIVLSAITTLMFLISPESINDTVTPTMIENAQHCVQSPNVRIKNLATIFLSDYSKIYIASNITETTNNV